MALEVTGWFVSGIISRLLDTTFDYLEEQIKWQTGMKQELLQMKETLPRIQAVVDAAESGQIEHGNPKLQSFRTWLWQLKQALYDADDVLDEFEYEQLEKQVKALQPNHSKLHTSLDTFQKNVQRSANRAIKQDPRLKRLNEVIITLAQIGASTSDFLQLVQMHNYHQHHRYLDQMKHPEAGITGSKIIGRDVLRRELLGWLRKSVTGNNLSVISIVGMGGMGKTTLARLVYDSATADFDEKVWVTVSNKFDAKVLMRMVFTAFKDDKNSRSEDLVGLQKQLMEELKTKKFLLVLDDVWNYDNIIEWENLIAPLLHGKKGSMILMTTRIDSVAEMAARLIGVEKFTLQLKGIKEDAYLSLFNHYAFMGLDPKHYKKLAEIAKQIANCLGGNPLAAKVIGNMLRLNMDEDYWFDILHSDVLIQNEGGDYILHVLKLSYNYLPLHLKSCFAYCGMFPDGYEFEREDMVRMWIAAGLVQREARAGQWRRLEDVGLRNFDDLVSRSLLDKVDDDMRDRTYYKMHDLIHELAQSVSSEECFRAMNLDLGSRIPSSVRHLYVNASDVNTLKLVTKLQNLRTLIIMSTDYRGEWKHTAVLAEVLRSTRSVRVLVLHVRNMTELPSTVGDLLHLRYLNLKGTKVKQLPPSICELYHLQFLAHGYNQGMVDFSNRCVFPERISNLVKLRQVILPKHCWHSSEPITGIGNLKELQEFDGFHVGKVRGSLKSYSFSELQYLTELRGVTIRNLNHVAEAEAKEATRAELKKKSKLKSLTLDWGYVDQCLKHISEEEMSKQAQLLDSLQPHNNLMTLQISGYAGKSSATWMRAENLPNLRRISLHRCREWQCLPCLGQLPQLKSLHLEDMDGVEKLCSEFHGEEGSNGGFPALEELHMEHMVKLEKWSGPTTKVAYGSWFPNLRSLSIRRCPRLKTLPPMPTSLKRLEVWKTGLISMPEIWKSSCSEERKIPLLEEIEIGYLKDLKTWFWPTTASLDEIKQLFPSLRALQVHNCPNLSPLPFKLVGEEEDEDKEEEDDEDKEEEDDDKEEDNDNEEDSE